MFKSLKCGNVCWRNQELSLFNLTYITFLNKSNLSSVGPSHLFDFIVFFLVITLGLVPEPLSIAK